MVEEDLLGHDDDGVPHCVLDAWNWKKVKLQHIQVGHINQTYHVGVEGETNDYVLQRLNPIFGPAVHYDIEFITNHLHQQGMVTPRLVRTRSKELWFLDEEGCMWRAMTWVEGENISEAKSASQCYEAGKLVAQFHLAVKNLKYEFRNHRGGVHDTKEHVKKLRHTLDSHDFHKLHEEVSELAAAAITRLDLLPSLEGLPFRIVHGDLKLNNILFDQAGVGLCVIDLDTLSHGSIAVELGDAFRSWCNPSGERQEKSSFSMAHFEAGMKGYMEGGGSLFTREELLAIPAAVETISLELAVRFLTDALAESYFGWDKTSFESAGHHNLLRAKSQLSLAISFAQQRSAANRIIKTIL